MILAIAPQKAAADAVEAGEKDGDQEDEDADRAGSLFQDEINYVEHDKRRVRVHGRRIRWFR